MDIFPLELLPLIREINFKSHLNSALLCKQGKVLTDLHMYCFILIFVWAHFCNETEKCQLWNSLKYFIILWPMKCKHQYGLNLFMFCQTLSDLVSALLSDKNFGNKLRNTKFKLYVNNSIFFN